MLLYLARERKSVYINYYPRASSMVAGLEFKSRVDAQTAKAILVPGAVAGLTLALERYGSLPLDVVLGPAIRYAENGFPVDETLSRIILDNVVLVQRESTTASVYLRDGFPLMEGDTLVQPELARTLRAVAQSGRAGFYEGPVARQIADGVTRAGGAMTLDDLRTHVAEELAPLSGSYRTCEIITAPPPHSGAMILEALNMLEQVNLNQLGHYATSAEAMYLLAETTRRVYADRTAYLADPHFEDVPVNGLIDKAYAASRFGEINRTSADPPEYRKTRPGNPEAFETPQGIADSTQAAPAVRKMRRALPAGDHKPIRQADTTHRVGQPGIPEPDSQLFMRGTRPPSLKNAAPVLLAEQRIEGDGHTTHLGIMDSAGNVVSLTQTMGTFFGSGLTVAGVLMNNAMSNFASTVARNAIEPGKQPRSSISPTIVLKDGTPLLSVGSPGATRIIATVIELIVNVVDYGMTAHDANDAPRFLCQKADDYLHLESRISQQVQDDLARRGHTLRVYGAYDLFFGGAQLVLRDPVTGALQGSADPRRGGVAIGY